ncbi:MAG: type II restriction endonuclease [Muricauda sp.]|nr:TaqI-like C-terminal specificity domain-containing protein [Allomuricauda sp.]MAU14645.1 type II restriction endonuclease [Allomuricauda sp.]
MSSISKPIKPKKALNKAFLKVKPYREEIELFKTNLIKVLDFSNEDESEEYHKNLVSGFLKDSLYHNDHFINTSGRKDQVIHIGPKPDSPVGVIIEAKNPKNKSEMVTVDNLNKKAFHELLLYFLRERITKGNLEVKNLIITNLFEWFIFDANDFEKNFVANKTLVKQFKDFEAGNLSGTNTDFFYNEIAKPYLSAFEVSLSFVYFDLRKYEKIVRNDNPKDDQKLVALFKVLSPQHLLKEPFVNDSNSLDKKFYSELLHIIGLSEIKKGSKKLIQRNEEGQRNLGSLLENTILQLDTRDKISRLPNPKKYGDTKDERLFNVALELVITWVNRILFLKLLEAQLIRYHKGDPHYAFLNLKMIKDYDDLDSLFFQVLAKRQEERNEEAKTFFNRVPYLNSSLFEPTDIEHDTLFVSNLRDDKPIPIIASTVLKDEKGKKRSGELSTLEYLFEFLDAYDFSSEGSEDIQEDNKTLINASVLGLIFEKINGYKDGSFFTPGFITMYMCRETIRKAVVQKFNEVKGWNCKGLDDVYDKIEDRNEANTIINSLKICDPAVGSGHFLVSALNELIAIKNDLKILQDAEGKRLKEYEVEVVNDELVITDDEQELFEYHPGNKESQRVQMALFHEKQTLIENCLFGVDINPNSVKICRLRLWIELLKNAYYKGDNELETLPNIDINIKTGNSLISRFALDDDLKAAFKDKKIAYGFLDYKKAVADYKNTASKEKKREISQIINEVKNNFRSTLDNKFIAKFQKAQGEVINEQERQNNLKAFGEKITKADKDTLKKLQQKAEKALLEKEEIVNNVIYENAFEWRFEFPEVLNDEGDYIGFDVVIGNPPYGVNLSNLEIEYFRKKFSSIIGHAEIYYLFIELALNGILGKEKNLSYIIPNAWLSNKYAFGVRKLILKNFKPIEIINFNQKVIFEDAQVETCILSIKKTPGFESIIVGHDLNLKYTFNPKCWFKDNNLIINFSENAEIQSILEKVNGNPIRLEELLDISNGCKPYQAGYGTNLEGKALTKEDVKNRIYHSKTKLSDQYFSELKGKHIQQYFSKQSNEYIKWGPWLMSPKASHYFFQPKILIRQIIGTKFICTIDETNAIADQSLYVAVPFEESKTDLHSFLAVLNSKLYGFFFRKFYSEEDDLFPKIKVNELKRLPYKPPNKEIENRLIELARKIISLKKENQVTNVSDLENEIDQLVYQLYGLTEEEIAIIESA